MSQKTLISAVVVLLAGGIACAHASDRQPGLLVRLYHIDGDMRFLPELTPEQLPNIVKVIPTLELRTDRGDFEPFNDRIYTEVVGFLTVKDAGKYTFRLLSDDGARLWLDDRLVIDNDGLHGPEPKDGEFELAAGEHALRVLHFENGGGEHLELQWRSVAPGAKSEFQLIPPRCLSHAADASRATAPGKKRIIPPLRRGRPGDGTPVAGLHPNFELVRQMRQDGLDRGKTVMLIDSRVHVVATRGGGGRAFTALPGWRDSIVYVPRQLTEAPLSAPIQIRGGTFASQLAVFSSSGTLFRCCLDRVGALNQGAFFRFMRLDGPSLDLVDFPEQGGLRTLRAVDRGQDGRICAGVEGRFNENDAGTFEMFAVRAMTNGFEVAFTKPLDPRCGWDPESYYIEQWPFVLEGREARRHEGTEGTEPGALATGTDSGGTAVSAGESREDTAHRAVAHGKPHPPRRDGIRYPVKSASVSPDRKKVFLEIENLKESHVVYIRLLPPCLSEDGELPWSTEAWYTLNKIPENRMGEIRTPPPPEPQNFLTDEEKAAGWRLLFDGKTTAGWRGYKKDHFPGGWIVQDGCLVRVGRGGDICTVAEFDNFELKLEWRISAGGNSGIFYRVSEKYGWPWESGPEMQVLDNAEHADGRNPKTSAGSNYALHAPVRDVTQPVGFFNQVRIVADGPHVEYWLNGVKIVEYELGSPQWEALVAGSKFKTMPHHGRVKKGHIVLQDHGDKVWYRNIKIRELH